MTSFFTQASSSRKWFYDDIEGQKRQVLSEHLQPQESEEHSLLQSQSPAPQSWTDFFKRDENGLESCYGTFDLDEVEVEEDAFPAWKRDSSLTYAEGSVVRRLAELAISMRSEEISEDVLAYESSADDKFEWTKNRKEYARRTYYNQELRERE